MKKAVSEWTCEDVCRFIKFVVPDLEGSELSEQFKSEEMDGEALLLVKEFDLVRLLSLKLGKAIKIYNYIQKLKTLAK
jgi:hypothetical protein